MYQQTNTDQYKITQRLTPHLVDDELYELSRQIARRIRNHGILHTINLVQPTQRDLYEIAYAFQQTLQLLDDLEPRNKQDLEIQRKKSKQLEKQLAKVQKEAFSMQFHIEELNKQLTERKNQEKSIQRSSSASMKKAQYYEDVAKMKLMQKQKELDRVKNLSEKYSQNERQVTETYKWSDTSRIPVQPTSEYFDDIKESLQPDNLMLSRQKKKSVVFQENSDDNYSNNSFEDNQLQQPKTMQHQETYEQVEHIQNNKQPIQQQIQIADNQNLNQYSLQQEHQQQQIQYVPNQQQQLISSQLNNQQIPFIQQQNVQPIQYSQQQQQVYQQPQQSQQQYQQPQQQIYLPQQQQIYSQPILQLQSPQRYVQQPIPLQQSQHQQQNMQMSASYQPFMPQQQSQLAPFQVQMTKKQNQQAISQQKPVYTNVSQSNNDNFKLSTAGNHMVNTQPQSSLQQTQNTQQNYSQQQSSPTKFTIQSIPVTIVGSQNQNQQQPQQQQNYSAQQRQQPQQELLNYAEAIKPESKVITQTLNLNQSQLKSTSQQYSVPTIPLTVIGSSPHYQDAKVFIDFEQLAQQQQQQNDQYLDVAKEYTDIAQQRRLLDATMAQVDFQTQSLEKQRNKVRDAISSLQAQGVPIDVTIEQLGL